MKINSISFKAKYTQEIKSQFDRGIKKLRKKPDEYAQYQENVKAIDDFQTDLVVTSLRRSHPVTGKLSVPIVIYKRTLDGLVLAAKKSTIDTTYKKVLKLNEVSTLEGIEALRKDLEDNF